jgi:hypothetical protein
MAAPFFTHVAYAVGPQAKGLASTLDAQSLMGLRKKHYPLLLPVGYVM